MFNVVNGRAKFLAMALTSVLSMTSLAAGPARGGGGGFGGRAPGGGGGFGRGAGGGFGGGAPRGGFGGGGAQRGSFGGGERGGGRMNGGGDIRRAPGGFPGNSNRGGNWGRGGDQRRNGGDWNRGGRDNRNGGDIRRGGDWPRGGGEIGRGGDWNRGGADNRRGSGDWNRGREGDRHDGGQIGRGDEGRRNGGDLNRGRDEGRRGGGEINRGGENSRHFGVREGASVDKHDVKNALPERAVKHKVPSYMERPETRRNIEESRGRVTRIREDVRVSETIRTRATYFDRDDFRGRIEGRRGDFDRYYHDSGFRHYYFRYYHYGFFGGYFYPVVPCADIWNYFWYPEVWWMYDAAFDWHVYHDWYGEDYVIAPFPYVGVYYPTATIRDMGIEVSALPQPVQTNFRSSLTKLTQALAQQIANNLQQSFTLQQNDIVIDHYQNLQNQALVVEGMVDRGDLHVAFKALLDLTGQNANLVFVPTGDTPTDADQGILTMMNQRIQALGGDPLQVDQEPKTVDNP